MGSAGSWLRFIRVTTEGPSRVRHVCAAGSNCAGRLLGAPSDVASAEAEARQVTASWGMRGTHTLTWGVDTPKCRTRKMLILIFKSLRIFSEVTLP